MTLTKAVRRVRASPAIFYIWGLVLAIVLLSPIAGSKFHLQDDHDEANWLGTTGILPWSRVWPHLMNTEVGAFGNGGRFRPIFYFIKLVTCAAFGDHPGCYYGLRIVFFAFFLSCLAHVLARLGGAISALLLTFLISGLYFWNDVWTLSLGPAEQIAVFGLALTLLGGLWFVASFVEERDALPIGTLPIIALGGAIASGSKENFFVFAGVPLFFTVLALARGRLPVLSLALTLPFMFFSVLMLYALFTAGGTKTDFYGADNSVAHRLHVMAERPLVLGFLASSIVAAAIAAFAGLRYRLRPSRQLADSTIIFVGLVAFFVFDLIWELFFYNGRLPSVGDERYELLYRLLPVAILYCFVGYFRFAFPGNPALTPTSLMSRYALILGTVFYVCALHPPFSLRGAALAAAAESKRFDGVMRAFGFQAQSHRAWPVVIEAADPGDYEPIKSFPQWKAYYRLPNVLRVRIDTINEVSIHNKFERMLVKKMDTNDSINSDEISLLHGACLAIGINQPSVSDCAINHYMEGPPGE